MKCRWFTSVVFALAFSFFGSFIINQNNTFAISDYSFTLDSINDSNYEIFCFDNEPSVNRNCSDYSYLKIEPNFAWSSAPAWNSVPSLSLIFGGNTSYTNTFPLYPVSSYILDLSVFNNDSDIYAISKSSSISNRNSLPSGWSFTITLTDSLSSGSPSGSLSITENGTYDVTNYAQAIVDVPASVVEGDYHNDLITINNSILTCGAICLVIYFFYCIYRMIIKTTGGV